MNGGQVTVPSVRVFPCGVCGWTHDNTTVVPLTADPYFCPSCRLEGVYVWLCEYFDAATERRSV